MICMCACGFAAHAQDVLVTESGDALKVYNIEMSPTTIFYQLSDDKDAPTERIARKDVLIIRKADGTKVDPNAAETATAPKSDAPRNKSRVLVEYPKHDPVTATISSDITIEKAEKVKGAGLMGIVAVGPIEKEDNKEQKVFSARTPDGKELRYAIRSESEHTLAVIKGKYKEQEYIIPEYVDVNGTQYTVTEIGMQAFQGSRVVSVQFPNTLKTIKFQAFNRVPLRKIILNDGIEDVGALAFAGCGGDEIYIPTTVKNLGNNSFWWATQASSYRGFSQGFFSCMPIFITEGNCKDYGIDEEAVRAYEKALDRDR